MWGWTRRVEYVMNGNVHHCQALCIGIGELSLKQRAEGSIPSLATKISAAVVEGLTRHFAIVEMRVRVPPAAPKILL